MKRGEKIMKIYSILKSISKAVRIKCWAESALTCLRPAEEVTLPPEEQVELENSYAAFEHNDIEHVDDPDVPSTSGLQSETVPDANEPDGHLGISITPINYLYQSTIDPQSPGQSPPGLQF